MSERLIVGTMSGTSADGVDAAVVRVAGRGLSMTAELVAQAAAPYDDALRADLAALRDAQAGDFASVVSAGRRVTLATAEAVREVLSAARVSAGDVAAVAAHGQTLCHAPPDTWQTLDPALLAAETGCRVVSDFRRADLAAGGQGAPLVPFADWLLFRSPDMTRVLLNLGGIANFTYLKGGGGLDDVVAFDTGPANCLSDALVRRHAADPSGHDLGGSIAATAQPHVPTAFSFARNPFTYATPPKSTDGPAMLAAFESACDLNRCPADLPTRLATASLAVAGSIQMNLDLHVEAWEQEVGEVVVAGGGTRNATLMSYLRGTLGDVPVRTTDELGVPSSAKESVAFALLAAATLDGEPSNVPSATGAARRVVLGSVTPRPF